jgi:hypothetical protein
MKISLIKASQNLPAKSKLIKEKPRKNLPAINTPNSTNSDNAAEANNEEPEIEQVTPTKKPDQLYPDNPSEFDLPDDPPKSGR